MVSTTYRRRAAGTGTRAAGRRKKNTVTAAERRRLLQLGASILLFLLVFVGRGILPERMAEWNELLGRDMDIGGAAAAFGRSVTEQGSVVKAVQAFWADITGGGEQPTAESQEETLFRSLTLPTPRQQMEDLTVGEPPSLNGSGPDEPAEDAAEQAGSGMTEPAADTAAQEPTVTAMAQEYDDAGEKLPDNVSFQYYSLGLKQTALPVSGTVTSGFGYRDHPVSGEYTFHTAQDIGTPKGTDVCAFADGTVRYIGENSIYGLYVRLDHDNGVSTFYAHCQVLLVSKGDEVKCGQVIARSGDTGNATGPHLHFSIDKDGVRLDPAWYLNGMA